MPPKSNQEIVFQTVQSMIASWGYTIVQANPQIGLISAQKRFGGDDPAIVTRNFQFSKDSNGNVKMQVTIHISNTILAPPVSTARRDIIDLSKEIAKTLNMNENDVVLEFQGEQKTLSNY